MLRHIADGRIDSFFSKVMKYIIIAILGILPLFVSAQKPGSDIPGFKLMSAEHKGDALFATGDYRNYRAALRYYRKAEAVEKAERMAFVIDSIYDRNIYMAKRYLASGSKSEFDREDFLDCLRRANELIGGSADVAELKEQYEMLPE